MVLPSCSHTEEKMNQLSETSLLRAFIEEDVFQKARSSNITILGARILTWEYGWRQTHILRLFSPIYFISSNV